MTCAYISIGNSDDRLSQVEWAGFVADVRTAIGVAASGARDLLTVHGAWLSAPDQPWQNACWCIETHDPDTILRLREMLAALAGKYRQDSIAWATAPHTDFLAGRPA